MKISEILWKAANERLWDGYGTALPGREFTCSVVADVEDPYEAIDFTECASVKFLKSLGCPIGGVRVFDKFEYGQQRQGARYAWLMFASMYAEEQGL